MNKTRNFREGEMEKISIPGYISWTRIADAVYIIDERDESIITLEDSGIRLWELIVIGFIRNNCGGKLWKMIFHLVI